MLLLKLKHETEEIQYLFNYIHTAVLHENSDFYFVLKKHQMIT